MKYFTVELNPIEILPIPLIQYTLIHKCDLYIFVQDVENCCPEELVYPGKSIIIFILLCCVNNRIFRYQRSATIVVFLNGQCFEISILHSHSLLWAYKAP